MPKDNDARRHPFELPRQTVARCEDDTIACDRNEAQCFPRAIGHSRRWPLSCLRGFSLQRDEEDASEAHEHRDHLHRVERFLKDKPGDDARPEAGRLHDNDDKGHRNEGEAENLDEPSHLTEAAAHEQRGPQLRRKVIARRLQALHHANQLGRGNKAAVSEDWVVENCSSLMDRLLEENRLPDKGNAPQVDANDRSNPAVLTLDDQVRRQGLFLLLWVLLSGRKKKSSVAVLRLRRPRARNLTFNFHLDK